eukprot:4405259-Prymnesium_polylepis.1
MMIIWPIGIPFLYSLLIWAEWKRISSEAPPDAAKPRHIFSVCGLQARGDVLGAAGDAAQAYSRERATIIASPRAVKPQWQTR